MKIERNKIVFALVILIVVLFMVSYYVIAFRDDEAEDINKNQIPVPELVEEQNQYETKLEALDAIKEEKEKTAPSLYPEHMIDDKGYFNPDYMEYEKQRIIDSVYQAGEINYEERVYRIFEPENSEAKPIATKANDTVIEINQEENSIISKEIGLEHQLFFASYPMKISEETNHKTDDKIYVQIDGTQIVRKDYRLQLRLTRNAIINGNEVPKNTLLYGFVSFKPNRTMIEIENINHQPVKLKAFDLQDGAEGIYIENTFRAEATNEVIDDMVDDINVAGVPQVSGVKKIFQRNNRQVKVTILDNYKLILKPKQ
ncbi:MAG TPA: conjugative transposon protein TraM [Flavobacteriaceae bacterium]|nr:conjugative transposon protein TraM [Bacteroidota bacterium]HPF11166.1 conjugative transposon protein TraM [Flavobacteriaceae bacterium]HRW43715.1 conjugative transposon protein TraM [Flavobacteriaceae bacterium]